MSKGPSPVETQRITVTLPKPLLQRLRERVPPRQRSAFIAEAVEEKLALEEQAVAIEEAAGCWRDEDHPEMRTEEEIDRWLATLRRSWSEPLLGSGEDDAIEEGPVSPG